MQIRRTVLVDKPLSTVFDYLSDFTTTTQWDPNTVITTRASGTGVVGTTYVNTSRFRDRQTQLHYVVQDYEPYRIVRLRGENATLTATDTIAFDRIDGLTRVTYTARFELKGVWRLAAPLIRGAVRELGDTAAAGMKAALEAL